MKWIFGLLLLCVSTALGQIEIDGDTPWIVMEEDYENPAIRAAIRDAERDWYKVFGYPPVVFKNDTRSHWDGPVVLFGSAAATAGVIDSQVPDGVEQHRLLMGEVKHNPAIAAIGSDTRGTIYAIYTFCEEVLGIDPMYVFTDNVPERQNEIIFTSADEYTSRKPTFENRGWFINDEELHDGLHRDPLGGNVISMEWMDKILESLLRCKGNMIAPESAPYSDATVYELCQRRDVIITFHHILPLGLNMMDWPKDVPFSYVTHKEILEDAWRKSAQAFEGKEVAWIINLRGESDGAFWHSDQAAPKDDAGRAQVISEAMHTQVEIIRQSDPDATIVAALWNEVGDLFHKGLLDIPDGICRMFPDDSRGIMRDDGGKYLQPGDGLYTHVMMQNNKQNRTSEMVPPSRIYKELTRYVEKGATKYAIVNVSSIRPAAMSVEAITDFLWDAEPALSGDPDDYMEAYMTDWHAKTFSPELAEELTALRLNYYNIPYARLDAPLRWGGGRGESLLQWQIQQLLLNYGAAVAEGKDLNSIKGFETSLYKEAKPCVEGTADYFPQLWQQTVALQERVPAGRALYYQSYFRYQIAVHMYSAQALELVVQAFERYQADQDSEAFANTLKQALAEQEKIVVEAHRAEYGIWDTMYMHVRLMDLWKTRLILKSTIAKIEGRSYTDNYRGYMKGSFWKSAQDYMHDAEGTYPYFHEHSGRGLDVLEERK